MLEVSLSSSWSRQQQGTTGRVSENVTYLDDMYLNPTFLLLSVEKTLTPTAVPFLGNELTIENSKLEYVGIL